MEGIVFTVLLWGLAVSLWQPGSCDSVDSPLVMTYPSVANGNIPNKVRAECSAMLMDSSPYDGFLLMYIRSSPSNMFALMLSENSTVTHSPGVEAQGDLTSADMNHLHLTLTNVKHNELFECLAVAKNKLNGRLLVYKDSVHVAVSNSTLYESGLSSAIGVLEQVIEREENDQRLWYDHFDKQITQTNANLSTFETSVNERFAILNGQIRVQHRVLDVIEREEYTSIMFTAIQAPRDIFNTDGRPLVYSNVTVNEGNGYSGLTGVFTVPVTGYYLFQFSVFISIKSSLVFVDLKSNEQTLKRAMGGRHDDWRKHQDSACVAWLRGMDRVYLSVDKVEKKSAFKDREFPNRFDGYLLKTGSKH